MQGKYEGAVNHNGRQEKKKRVIARLRVLQG